MKQQYATTHPEELQSHVSALQRNVAQCRFAQEEHLLGHFW